MIQIGDSNSVYAAGYALNNRSFEKLLLEAIDEGLSSLGDSPKQMIYLQLKTTSNINKEDIPRKIEEFASIMEKIFGFGAKVLEKQIMDHIYKKIGNAIEYNRKNENLALAEYVAAIRQTFLEMEKRAPATT